MIVDDELEQILEDEGFESRPYQDTLGVWTIGHGLTSLTEKESRSVVQYFRLPHVHAGLRAKYKWLENSPPEVSRVMLNMAYQLGLTGLSKFVNTIEYLKQKNYSMAAEEMLNSRWAQQTPNRAQRLSDRIRALDT